MEGVRWALLFYPHGQLRYAAADRVGGREWGASAASLPAVSDSVCGRLAAPWEVDLGASEECRCVEVTGGRRGLVTGAVLRGGTLDLESTRALPALC